MDEILRNILMEYQNRQHQPLKKEYQVYPISFKQSELEHNDKIILPQSTLEYLDRFNFEMPYLFEIENGQIRLYSGVAEFSEEEHVVYLPYWMMMNLHLQEGDKVLIQPIQLPKGEKVKLRPQTQDFLELEDPKQVLEKNLERFCVLTPRTTIPIQYFDGVYAVDVIETYPNGGIKITDTDLEVEFEPPLDYQEPEPVSDPMDLSDRNLPPEEEKEEQSYWDKLGPGRTLT